MAVQIDPPDRRPGRTDTPQTDEFSIGIVFTVDLVLGATANVSFEGGFSVDIPTGSTFTMPLDLSKDNIADL